MITVHARKLTRTLLIVLLVLGVVNLGEGYHRFLYGDVDTPLAELLGVFDFDREDSVPTWLAVILLAAAAAALAVIARAAVGSRDRFRRHWIGLAAIFAFLSLDESASLHERTRDLFTDWTYSAGVFYHGWVILYGALVLLFAVVYLPFLRHLPSPSRRLFALAGTVYVGGALGAEMLGGHLLVTQGPGIQTGLTVIVEEMLELTGVVIFLHALLDHLATRKPSVTFVVETPTIDSVGREPGVLAARVPLHDRHSRREPRSTPAPVGGAGSSTFSGEHPG